MAFALRRLNVERYRALQKLTWLPNGGLNLLVGSADGGKSTILSAISLLLSQGIPGPRSEFDYHDRRVGDGFLVEAVIGDIDFDITSAEGRQLPLFGWGRDGSLHGIPEGVLEPVICVRAVGTPDLEVLHEMLQPSGDTVAFSLGLRRRIGTLRISNEPANAASLRMSPGSLLGRQFDMADLRGSVREALSGVDQSLPVSDSAAAVVKSLDSSFRSDGLPSEIGLGLLSPQGSDLVTMVGLVSGADPSSAIPLGLMGSGTRTLITLNILAKVAARQSVVLIEEPERGLEPFSQRKAAIRIVELSAGSQSFVTTHSPIMLEEMATASVWRVERNKDPIAMTDKVIVELFKVDSEAIFSPKAIICEGATECGFLSIALPHLAGESLNGLGIRLVDGNGQPQCLSLAAKLADAGMNVAIFVDNEGDHAGTRAEISRKVQSFIWEGVTNLEEAVAKYLPYDAFLRVMKAARLEERYALCQIRDALPPKVPPTAVDWGTIVASDTEENVRSAIYAVSNRHSWYKSFENGAALASAVIEVGLPEGMRTQIDRFVQALK